MKTELRPVPHSTISGAIVLEVWHDGQFIATITGDDGPGVRVISKHPLRAVPVGGLPNVVQVKIEPIAAK